MSAPLKEIIQIDDSLSPSMDSWSDVPDGYTLLIRRSEPSLSSVTIGSGSKTFVLNMIGDRGWTASTPVFITDRTNAVNTMTGTVTSYTSGTQQLVVNVSSFTGSGTSANWGIEDTSNQSLLLLDDQDNLLLIQ
jgi:hypothetical protein